MDAFRWFRKPGKAQPCGSQFRVGQRSIVALLVAILCASLIGAFTGAVLYQRVGATADERNYPPPGRLVDVGGRRMHLVESGAGSPAVVLESGIAASCLNWTNIHTEAARFTRVCSYDRGSL